MTTVSLNIFLLDVNFDKFTIELHFLLIMAPISLNIYICIYIYKSSILLCFLKDKYILLT